LRNSNNLKYQKLQKKKFLKALLVKKKVKPFKKTSLHLSINNGISLQCLRCW